MGVMVAWLAKSSELGATVGSEVRVRGGWAEALQGSRLQVDSDTLGDWIK